MAAEQAHQPPRGTAEVGRLAREIRDEHRSGARPSELDRLHGELTNAMRRDVAPDGDL
jgi:hypothetical protein